MANYTSQYSGQEIDAAVGKANTALQAVPDTYRTAAEQDTIDEAIEDRIETIEGKESGWNGKYTKPSGGIPSSDMASAVQTSLGKADTALQEHQSLAAYRTAAAQDAIDAAKQPLIDASHKLSYNLLSDTPTIPTVPSIATTINAQSTNAETAGAAAAYGAINPDKVRDTTTAAVDKTGANALAPNVTHEFMLSTGVTSLAFDLASPADADIDILYRIKFRSGATPTSVVWPSGVLYPQGSVPTIEANAIYYMTVDGDGCLDVQYYKASA